jgi:hypothetical protein
LVCGARERLPSFAMREPALGLKTSLLNDGSFMKICRAFGGCRGRHCRRLMRRSICWMSGVPERLRRLTSARRCSTCFSSRYLSGRWRSRECYPIPLRCRIGARFRRCPNGCWVATRESLAKRGSSGGHDALPPSAGQLAPAAHFAFTAPHLRDSRPHPLVVPVTIAEPDAPEFVRTPTEIGLPWMDR